MSRRKGARQCGSRHQDGCNDPLTVSLPSPPSTTSSIPDSSATASSTPPSLADSTTTAAKSTTVAAAVSSSSSDDAGTIAGSVVGGVIFLVLVGLGLLLYLRARKKKRTPPSSEFMNSIRAGAAPVLRLDSGAEYTPALAEKGGYTHYPPAVSLPFTQNSYYASPPIQDMKFPDEMMDVPSARPSVDKPLHPQRFSSQQQANDSFIARHHPGTSVGSRRELWGSDAEVASARQSPAHTDSILHFAPRLSLDDPSSQPLHVSYSPPSLHPLRRQPDP